MIRRMKVTKEKKKEIRITNFPQDDRIWRIDWYDKVSRDPNVSSDPKVNVMISPVDNNTNSIFDDYTTNWSQSKIITLSISYLNRISIGSTWVNGKLVGLPNRKKDRAYAFKVSIPPQSLEPLFFTLGEELRGIKWNYMHFYKANCLVFENCRVSFMNKNFLKKVIFPCPELLRFYFATSTKLVRNVIYYSGSSLMKKLVILIDSEGNIRTDPSGSPMLLTLKTRIPDGDCWSIARLLTDKIATRETNRLYREFASKNLMYNNVTYIKMGFPFSGPSQLNVFGKLSEDGESLLVLNIAFCNADFNFTELVLDRENSNLAKNKKELVREVGFSYSKKSNLDGSSEILLSNHGEPTKNVSRQTPCVRIVDVGIKEKYP
ncbi:MAG: hypothetical protein AB7E31_14610 [Desulfitobacterium sp.]